MKSRKDLQTEVELITDWLLSEQGKTESNGIGIIILVLRIMFEAILDTRDIALGIKNHMMGGE